MSGFDRIAGHERVVSAVRRALGSARTHHAYLFTGPEGVGKRLLALTLAKAVNCLHSDAELRPCDECRECQSIDAGRHPDVVVLTPDTSKARWVIKIEGVRQLVQQVRYKPYQGRRRVGIIDFAETLTEEGANAFLKTLEEPTGESMFVLVSAQPQRLLDTIRSRCQQLRFGPLPQATVERLCVEHGMDPKDATVLAGFSDGSVSRAFALANEQLLAQRNQWLETLQQLAQMSDIEVTKVANDMARQPSAKLRSTLDGWLMLHRDIALLCAGSDPARLANRDLHDTLAKLAARTEPARAAKHTALLTETRQQVERYIDAKLLLESLLFELRQ